MYNDIIQFLDQRRLKEALAQLEALAAETENWKLQSDVENLRTTYGYMLQYAAKGTDDPERGKLYGQLRRTAYELADEAEFLRRNRKAYGHFADKFRSMQQFPPHSFAELCLNLETLNEDLGMAQLTATDETQRKAKVKELCSRHEKAVDELFDKIWTSALWTEEEQAGAESILHSLLVPANDIAVMASAVTLSLLQIFDARKFRFLLSAYQSRTESAVTQRALIGIALTAYYQEKRLCLYPDLTASLSLLNDSGNAPQELETIQTLLLLCRETEKIDKKMREEIIPQMMRNPKLMNPDSKITDIEDLEDLNPEWEKGMDKISEKIRELGELQMEGADTYMSTFSQLKSYPFFRQAAHWFYPFDRQTPEIADLFQSESAQGKSLVGMLMDSPMFCNSDKYSFCLTLHNVPASQREFLNSQLAGQSEMLNEINEKTIATGKEPEKESTVSRQYIHDLYRFFKLWMFRSEQHDIFKDDLALWNCKALEPMLHSPEQLRHIADHLFAKNYLQEASALYTELSGSLQGDAEIWQKLGFSLQKLKKYPEAAKAYEQADLLKPEHVWTLKHLAQCYKRMRAYERALEYFYRVESMQPENLNLLLQIGQSLASLRMYDKALAYFFKVEYLDEAPIDARRAIGWCYFMTGKYADAIRFYDKIVQAGEAQTADWLNAGHAHMADGNVPKALECYRQAEARCKTHDDFMKMYLADKDVLIEQGIAEENIYIVPDLM